MSQHWKNIERKKCRDMGGQRKGQIGPDGYSQGSDDDGSIWCSLEVKYVNRYTLRQSWIDQARRNGEHDGRPWVIAMEQRRDKGSGLFICEWNTGVELAALAGLNPLHAAKGSNVPATPTAPLTSVPTWTP